MSRKRLMLLGGNYFQMTATKAAKELGYYVISVDYLPDNPAHALADEYHNISTIDKKAILEKARELKIDGILSYASDVSAPTAAYVAEELGLPTNPYESVMILTHKDRFRAFLKENGFPMPAGSGFQDREEARAFAKACTLPVMLKPVDSSGSKGVTKLTSLDDFDAAFDEAMSYSIGKEIIIEEFLEREGYQMDGDVFAEDGKIIFWGECDQHHDLSCTPFTPDGHSFPPTDDEAVRENARSQIQRVFDLLGMKMGGYNCEYIVGKDGKVYLLEVAPRHGGNLISDAVKLSCGVDMAKASCRQAVGEAAALEEPHIESYATSYVVHALSDGRYRGLRIEEALKSHVRLCDMFVKEGEKVRRFRNGGDAIGAMLLTFDTAEELKETMNAMNDLVHVDVDPETL